MMAVLGFPAACLCFVFVFLFCLFFTLAITCRYRLRLRNTRPDTSDACLERLEGRFDATEWSRLLPTGKDRRDNWRERETKILQCMGISDASMGIDIHASSWKAPWSGDLFSC